MADTALESELSEEFSDFGIDIEGNLPVLEKLTDICHKNELKADEVLARWVAHTMKMKAEMQNIDEDLLDDFEKTLKKADKKISSSKKSTPHHKNSYNRNTINNRLQDDVDESDMLGSYGATPQGKESVKRQHVTPEGPRNVKRFAPEFSTPITQNFSPASMASPALTTPSAKYDARIGKGDVVATFGASDRASISWKGCAKNIDIRNFDESCNVVKPYKYMFQKLQDKADILNDMISTLADQIKQKFSLSDFENIWTQTQEDITLAGRVCCDSVGRINSKSVVLEGSRETSAGQRLPLDLTELKNYSLFPGQIVSMTAKNSTGSCIVPSSIHSGARLPFYSGCKKNCTVNEDPFTVYVTCGPYATCDNDILSYTPLDDLCSAIKTEAPDVVIMLGPFVDSKQPLIEKGEIDDSFDDLFIHCQSTIELAVENLPTEVIFVPSQRDVFHDSVYPQPPFETSSETKSKIKMMSDPCTLMVNDVCFGITSTDILFHLGAEEVSSFNVRSDRLGRLANHLLLQQCYYPLHPSSEEVNLDYERFENHGFMPVTPDVLVVPSDLRYFIKDIEGCLCVNPGRLVKGQTGGSYMKMLVKPTQTANANKSSVISKSIVQIVRM